MNSLNYLPFVKKHLIDRGTLFTKHFCTIALCCPSRVSLWTGKAAHNTNVTDVNPPYGGYPKFIQQGLNSNWLPVWLQNLNYNTYYTGKLFNSHTVSNYDKPFPAGFTGSDFLLDPYTYQYYNASFQRNKDPPTYHEGSYSTDVLAEKAYGFLDEAVAGDKPFFLTIAPVAPHSNVRIIQDNSDIPVDDMLVEFDTPLPAERHKHLFKDVKIPRTTNFNPEKPSGVSWIKDLPRQNESNVDYSDHFYRQRLRALQAVDELVDGVFARLEQYGILDNTYVFYSTDNGYHVGQHRLQPGKECGFEEDINIPLIVRGPGVPEGHTTDIVTTHTDLASTFLTIAGREPFPDSDGAVIPLTSTGLAQAKLERHEHATVEYWGFALGEGKHSDGFHWNNTYKGLRITGNGYNLYYSVWCSGEHQLYDLDNDPQQLHNLFSGSFSFDTIDTSATILGQPLKKVVPRLDSLLFVLKSCKGTTCIKPWGTLHPEGNVNNLADALSKRFDRFYEVEQRRIEYSRCEAGYILDAEGPQFEVDGLVYRQGARWDQWT
ncbi:arylsulfatase [Aulographum hederae CBS 113979]|uniref:Arylsulfatase n=1 Tax=Aulographum hederae CBS 113979 TaxID=1176131 RepID=A0A6G1GJQ2_9PEZI|nr:arylsulfatase [Aulographum hederae CBS 113979]